LCLKVARAHQWRPYEIFDFHFSLLVGNLWSAILPAHAQLNVTQEHNNLSAMGFTSTRRLRLPLPLL
jgi:hypothetical protein